MSLGLATSVAVSSPTLLQSPSTVLFTLVSLGNDGRGVTVTFDRHLTRKKVAHPPLRTRTHEERTSGQLLLLFVLSPPSATKWEPRFGSYARLRSARGPIGILLPTFSRLFLSYGSARHNRGRREVEQRRTRTRYLPLRNFDMPAVFLWAFFLFGPALCRKKMRTFLGSSQLLCRGEWKVFFPPKSEGRL